MLDLLQETSECKILRRESKGRTELSRQRFPISFLSPSFFLHVPASRDRVQGVNKVVYPFLYQIAFLCPSHLTKPNMFFKISRTFVPVPQLSLLRGLESESHALCYLRPVCQIVYMGGLPARRRSFYCSLHRW